MTYRIEGKFYQPTLDVKSFVRENSYGYVTRNVEYHYLDEIRRDGGTQPRAAINLQHVKLLEEQMEDGQQLEPITVFYDGTQYWLADGFHRWHAHRNREEDAIACFIHQGSQRDAVLYSVGANSDNKPALPRSREDKRRAVLTLLNDPEWSTWSDREIAGQCRVSDKTVAHLRNSADTKLNIEEKAHLRNSADTKLNIEKKARRGGKTYTINTTNIGRKAATPIPTSHVTVKNDHPLFAGHSGKIIRLLNPDAAIVELTDGNREKIQLKYLDVHDEKNSDIQIAHHLKLLPGGLIEIHVPTNNKINGRLGRIEAVHETTVSVWVRDVNTMTMHKHTLKHHFVETVPMDREPQLVEVCDRIDKLRLYHLDPFEIEILLLLQRPIAFTPTELEYLAQIEERQGRGRGAGGREQGGNPIHKWRGLK